MLIDETHKKWAWFTLIASALLLLLYFIHAHSLSGTGRSPSGATIPGLIFGGVALALMIFCALLGVRKKVRIWRLGRAQTWLRAHLWLGLLTLPLVFCHSGMKFGHQLSLAIMILYLIVLVSGLIGLALQNIVPRMLLDRVPAETTFEQLAQVCQILRDEADALVTTVCGPLDAAPAPGVPAAPPVPGVPAPVANAVPAVQPVAAVATAPVKGQTALLMKNKPKPVPVQGRAPRSGGREPIAGAEPLKEFYLREVRPYLEAEGKSARLGAAQSAQALFEYARTLTPPAAHEAVSDLESICEERRQLAMQARLHAWLHGWLFVHAPLSYLLLVLVVLHAIVAPLGY